MLSIARTIASLVGSGLVATAATAGIGQDTASLWREIARGDAEAALEMIEGNHPGARAEVGDAEFQARLESAREHVEERLPHVANYQGYSALMLGLANDFGDGHIWSSAILSANRVDWPGLVAERRAGRWVIGHDLNEGGELSGAELVSCDGKAADAVGRERIGQFRADPDVEADLASNAYALFIDDGNPFQQRPANCTFRLAGGAEVTRPLPWRTVSTAQVQRDIGAVLQQAAAGMGVEKFAGGYWIALQSLSSEAEAVVAEVDRLQAELRAAPMVVIDLRGNGGGNSAYSSSIAALLAGPEAMQAIGDRELSCAGAFWRASAGNARAMRALSDEARGERAEWLGGIASELEAAVAAGQTFSPELPACASEVANAARPVGAPPPLATTGRLVLVTDRACFSSCLIATDTFRRLGALHIGEATDRSTRYMEVREEVLPSGLRTFSTLMKLALGAGDFGPYMPDVPYPGAMHDSDALKAWVAALSAGEETAAR